MELYYLVVTSGRQETLLFMTLKVTFVEGGTLQTP